MFVMITEIGDRIYELQSSRRWELELTERSNMKEALNFWPPISTAKPVWSKFSSTSVEVNDSR